MGEQKIDSSDDLREILRHLRSRGALDVCKDSLPYVVLANVRPWPIPAFSSLSEAKAYCVGVTHALQHAKFSKHFDPYVALIDYDPKKASHMERSNSEIFGEIYVVDGMPGATEAYRMNGELLELISM